MYDRIVLPAEGNTALYYLFYTKDFGAEYAQKFGFDAHIARVGNVQFIQKSCPTEEPLAMQKGEKVLIVNRYSCAENSTYEKKDRIRGVNDLLGFTSYTSQSK